MDSPAAAKKACWSSSDLCPSSASWSSKRSRIDADPGARKWKASNGRPAIRRSASFITSWPLDRRRGGSRHSHGETGRLRGAGWRPPAHAPAQETHHRLLGGMDPEPVRVAVGGEPRNLPQRPVQAAGPAQSHDRRDRRALSVEARSGNAHRPIVLPKRLEARGFRRMVEQGGEGVRLGAELFLQRSKDTLVPASRLQRPLKAFPVELHPILIGKSEPVEQAFDDKEAPLRSGRRAFAADIVLENSERRERVDEREPRQKTAIPGCSEPLLVRSLCFESKSRDVSASLCLGQALLQERTTYLLQPFPGPTERQTDAPGWFVESLEVELMVSRQVLQAASDGRDGDDH